MNYALRPAFTPLTLLLTILGFIFFWPLGLAMLAYMIWGHRLPEVREHFEGMKRDWQRDCADWGFRGGRHAMRSGNAAFDEYRSRELKRLEEERRRLDEELRDFEAYLNELRRARDAEEFDRFMRERPRRSDKSGNGNGNGDRGQDRPSV